MPGTAPVWLIWLCLAVIVMVRPANSSLNHRGIARMSSRCTANAVQSPVADPAAIIGIDNSSPGRIKYPNYAVIADQF
jgi:hypothetical protein